MKSKQSVVRFGVSGSIKYVDMYLAATVVHCIKWASVRELIYSIVVFCASLTG